MISMPGPSNTDREARRFFSGAYTAEHVLTLAPDVHVDDVMSALLNYAEERWPQQPDGSYTTFLVRRGPSARPGRSEPVYEAQLRPVDLIVARTTGVAPRRLSISSFERPRHGATGRQPRGHGGPATVPDGSCTDARNGSNRR